MARGQQTVQQQGPGPLSLEDEAALVSFAEDMNNVLRKLKQADETGTNALLLNHEVGSLLAYIAAANQMGAGLLQQ